MSGTLIVCTPDELKALVRESLREELANTDRGEPKDVLNLTEVCELLQRDRKTVMRFVHDESLPAHPIGERELRFRRGEVLAWLSARSVNREGEGN